jgi:uncharacterized lipoprotein YddW (UPF0748 family)
MRFLPAFLIGVLLVQSSAAQTEPEPFRAVWIATVFNLNFPSKSGLAVETQKSELIQLLETARRNRLNAVLFQVRPESDAVYSSSLEPWSRYLTGDQGGNPAYDPLDFLIQQAKPRGIAVHAWINPYRAAATADKPRAARSAAERFRRFCYPVYTMLWLDPGALPVQDHVVAVVRDLVRRYPIAGIHLDDYFYPYPKDPQNPVNFPDDAVYRMYRNSGGTLGKADWRRRNVNQLVSRLHAVIKTEAPHMKFGISPFGIYTPGEPATVTGKLDQLNHLYADPVQWLRDGTVDYLAPQLYWRDKGDQSFSELLKWWRSRKVNPRGIPIYPGIAVERLNGSHNWPISEIRRQLEIEKKTGPGAQAGFVLWNIKPLQENSKGVSEIVRR